MTFGRRGLRPRKGSAPAKQQPPPSTSDPDKRSQGSCQSEGTTHKRSLSWVTGSVRYPQLGIVAYALTWKKPDTL